MSVPSGLLAIVDETASSSSSKYLYHELHRLAPGPLRPRGNPSHLPERPVSGTHGVCVKYIIRFGYPCHYFPCLNRKCIFYVFRYVDYNPKDIEGLILCNSKLHHVNCEGVFVCVCAIVTSCFKIYLSLCSVFLKYIILNSSKTDCFFSKCHCN
jgi:hypothetical protein